MSKVSVFDYGWIDLVFEGRNKNYGAYQLRRENPKTTLIALFSGILLVAVLGSIPTAINYFSSNETPAEALPEIKKEIIEVSTITPEPPVKKVEPREKPQAPAPATRTPEPTIRYTNPVAVTTVTPVEIPNTAQVNQTAPSTVTLPGDGSGGFSTGPASPTGKIGGTGTGATPNEGTTGIISNPDTKPVFPGGIEKFYAYIGKKFDTPKFEDVASLQVFVYFVIEKDGSMSNFRVTRDDPKHSIGKEALRVLQSIKTRWEPGRKNGQPVRTAYNLPITVNIH